MFNIHLVCLHLNVWCSSFHFPQGCRSSSSFFCELSLQIKYVFCHGPNDHCGRGGQDPARHLWIPTQLCSVRVAWPPMDKKPPKHLLNQMCAFLVHHFSIQNVKHPHLCVAMVIHPWSGTFSVPHRPWFVTFDTQAMARVKRSAMAGGQQAHFHDWHSVALAAPPSSAALIPLPVCTPHLHLLGGGGGGLNTLLCTAPYQVTVLRAMEGSILYNLHSMPQHIPALSTSVLC